ncbi:MAG: amidohydrolase [bacterium]|nr:MAG: amidohydrolase [bacterium]
MKKTISSYLPELIALRHDLHRHPELGFEETRTARIIADRLHDMGVEVHTGWAKTGVIGVLRAGTTERTIALRADMDALPIREKGEVDHASVREGLMHACGHDGHLAMLLGAARYLAKTRRFDGTVVFVFQPAEEGGGGARLLVEEGLFDRFPIEAVYGMHNRSGLEAGAFALRTGPVMAATDNFEIVIRGLGTHAALPHTGTDPIIVGAEVVTALQTIVSREISALDHAVISVTLFQSGTTWNVIPDAAVLRGCTRMQTPEVREQIKGAMERVVAGVCGAHGAEHTFEYLPGYPPTVNTEREAAIAAEAARAVAGPGRVQTEVPPLMASEDFSYFLENVPGCYVFIGNGFHTMSHRSDYDFNDDIIGPGVEFWVRIVELELGG